MKIYGLGNNDFFFISTIVTFWYHWSFVILQSHIKHVMEFFGICLGCLFYYFLCSNHFTYDTCMIGGYYYSSKRCHGLFFDYSSGMGFYYFWGTGAIWNIKFDRFYCFVFSSLHPYIIQTGKFFQYHKGKFWRSFVVFYVLRGGMVHIFLCFKMISQIYHSLHFIPCQRLEFIILARTVRIELFGFSTCCLQTAQYKKFHLATLFGEFF